MADLRSSYKAVADGPTVGKDQALIIPSAPPLEAVLTNAPHLDNTQGKPSQPGAVASFSSIEKDDKFSAWDDQATRILIMNRLGMNERFERAQNKQERDELWTIILNLLVTSGYSFTLIDIIQYWEFQFYIYKSNVNSLSVDADTDITWEHFQAMENVFKCSTENQKSKSLSNEVNNADVSNSFSTNAASELPVVASLQKSSLSEPIVAAEQIITSQPRSMANNLKNTSIPTNSNRYDDDNDCCCCCCLTCCDDCLNEPVVPSGRTGRYTTRTGGYSGRSGGYRSGGYRSVSDGYTSHKNNYNDYSDGLTNDYSNIRLFSNNFSYLNDDDINDDNSCIDKKENICCDTNADGTDNDRCCNTNDRKEDDDRKEDSCCDTNDGCYNANSRSENDCCDTGGGGGTDNNYGDSGGDSNDYGCSDTGGGGTDYDYGDSGGDSNDYGCCDTGGGSDD